ncbi:MAG: indole-3-glycerol phosphate synthase TrpC [Anaerolineae bacterium]|nr:indole-3-glycerol phosphate synthase TrpC [Anaerolineae bacterium]
MNKQYVSTGTVLDNILAHKVDEIAAQKAQIPLSRMRDAVKAAAPPRDMIAALRRDTVALIAEIKHASPSRGVLIENFDPVVLGTTYAEHGAAAISVLTDEAFFQGHLDYLRTVRSAVTIPVLRKDFIIDPYQVVEARAAGADAVLLIVAALDNAQLADLYALVVELGMAALVEVHNEHELTRALRITPALLGINNRDLKTFDVSLGTTERLARQVPDGITLVAESGIFTQAHVQQMGRAGANAILVGEALVRAPDTGAAVRTLSSQPAFTGSSYQQSEVTS